MTQDQQKVDPFKEDFKAFLWAIWRFLNLPAPTPVQLDIADYLQYGPRRKVIMAFRGVGKSWITAAFVLWCLYRDPQEKILVVSASKERADNFSTFCLRLLHDMPLLQHLHPSDDQRSSKIAFDVRPSQADHAPSVKSAGITGQITGSRAHRIVADDIEVPSNSDTTLQRDKLAELVKEFDAVLKPGGEITYLGTPQTEESLYNKLPERGYAVQIWPARVPDQVEKYGTKIAPYVTELIASGSEVRDPIDPDRFDEDDLIERELSYGRSGFALQFQLDTSLSDADRYPLKLRDLIVMDLDAKKGPTELMWCSDRDKVLELPTVGLELDRYHAPMMMPTEFAPYTGSVMFIDPSGRGRDETAYSIVNALHGYLFLMDSGGNRGGYDDDLLKSLLRKAQIYGVNRILVEPNFGDGMFARLLRSHCNSTYNVTIEDAPWARMQKEARIIDTLEPVMNQHRLVVNKSLVEKDYRSTEVYTAEDQLRCRLFYQMTRVTRAKDALVVDDRLDALAGSVAYWLESMAMDSKRALQTHRQETLEKALKRHIEHSTGRLATVRSPTLKGIRALSKVRT